VTRPRLVLVAVALALAAGVLACGARTMLDVLSVPLEGAVNVSPDSGAPVDSGALADSAAPPTDADAQPDVAIEIACAAMGPPGTIAWTATLGAGMGDAAAGLVIGPLAADSRGTTYYVVQTPAQPGLYFYTLVAVDACGHALWWTDAGPAPPGGLGSLRVLVSPSQVVINWTNIDAFDPATGRRLWSVDLTALAERYEILVEAPSAGSADGTTYLGVQIGDAGAAAIVSFSPTGATSLIATTDHEGSPASLIVDAEGHLDLLSTSNDPNVQTGYVDTFTLAGTPLFASVLSCEPVWDAVLASGQSFEVVSSGPCVLTLEGMPGFSPAPTPLDGSSQIVIDGQDNLYVAGSTDQNLSMLVSFDPAGQVRWSSPLVGQPVFGGALVLGAGGTLFVLEEPPSTTQPPTTVTLSARETTMGTVVWSKTFPLPAESEGASVMLLTPANQLIFAAGDTVTSVAAGVGTSMDAEWPTVMGDLGQRAAARGQ
jgi:outer membrane protein assembly factor BamB